MEASLLYSFVCFAGVEVEIPELKPEHSSSERQGSEVVQEKPPESGSWDTPHRQDVEFVVCFKLLSIFFFFLFFTFFFYCFEVLFCCEARSNFSAAL